MKRIGFFIGLLVLLTAGGAFAVPVDFGSLTQTTDIANGPVTVSGVTFSYDNSNTPDAWADIAAVDQAGVFGSTFGTLRLVFSGLGATGLLLNFSIDGVGGPDPDALLAVFDNGSTAIVPGVYDSGLGQIAGTLHTTGETPFTMVSLLFSPVATYPADPAPDPYTPYYFSVTSVDYEPFTAVQPVPEPGTLLLLAMGGAGILAWRAIRRRTTPSPIPLRG